MRIPQFLKDLVQTPLLAGIVTAVAIVSLCVPVYTETTSTSQKAHVYTFGGPLIRAETLHAAPINTLPFLTYFGTALTVGSIDSRFLLSGSCGALCLYWALLFRVMEARAASLDYITTVTVPWYTWLFSVLLMIVTPVAPHVLEIVSVKGYSRVKQEDNEGKASAGFFL